MPRLINLHDEIPPKENYVRIDRQSPYGNPFRIGIHGNRDACIIKHDTWFLANEVLKARVLTELAGKDLGCWCWPEKCHGGNYLRFLGVPGF